MRSQQADGVGHGDVEVWLLQSHRAGLCRTAPLFQLCFSASVPVPACESVLQTASFRAAAPDFHHTCTQLYCAKPGAPSIPRSLRNGWECSVNFPHAIHYRTKPAILAAALSLSALTLHAARRRPQLPQRLRRWTASPTASPSTSTPAISASSSSPTSVVRVAFARSADFFTRASLDVLPNPSLTSGWKLAERPASFVLSTAKLHVIVDRNSGAVSFTDAAGRPILSEAAGSRTLEPATVQGEETFHIQQRWKAQPDESLYGLGQMQLGITDIKGYDLDLWQHNTNIVVPFLVSSRGYGILWDNTSFTRFGDLRPFAAIPPANLFDADGKPGGLTLAPIDGSAPPSQSADIGIDMRRNRPPGGGRPAPLKAQRWQGFRPRPRHRRLPVPGLLQRRNPGLVRRQTRHGPLASELEPHQRSGPRPSPRRTQISHQDRERSRAAVHPHLPLEDTSALRRHLALVAGRRRHRLHLRLRPLQRSGHRRLSPPHRPRHHAAQLGLRPLAVAPALRDRRPVARCRQAVPPAPDPLRQHRAGLAVLARRRLGLAPVRPHPLSRSCRLDQLHSTNSTPIS